MENDLKTFIEIILGILTAANSVAVALLAFKKLKPEVKKIEAEGDKTEAEVDSEIVSAAHVNLEGAEISTSLLMQRIKELREDLDNEKKARRDDAEYFRRRFRDAEREARDYRQWAARLAKQVIELGKVPVAFVPSIDNDSDKIRVENKDSKEDILKEEK